MKKYYSYLIKKVMHIKKLLAVDYLHINSSCGYMEHFYAVYGR